MTLDGTDSSHESPSSQENPGSPPYADRMASENPLRTTTKDSTPSSLNSEENTDDDSSSQDIDPASMFQDTQSNFGSDSFPPINEQRHLVMLAQNGLEPNSIVFMVPSEWYAAFHQDPTLERLSADEIRLKLGKIDTSSILVDPNNTNLLKHDYNYDHNHQCYVAVTKKVWVLLISWYGLKPGCLPVTRVSILNKATGGYDIEFYIPSFQLRKLAAGNIGKINGDSKNYRLLEENHKVYFSGSKTVGELYYYIKNFISENMEISSKSNLKLRLWLLSDPNMSNAPLFLNLTAFKKVSSKKVLSPDLFDRTLNELDLHGGDLLIELNDHVNNKFPSDFFVKKLENLEGEGSSILEEEVDSDSSEKQLSRYSKVPEPTDGTKGLNNLGNTCYMNSALQCLVHIPELSQYFFHNVHNIELNTDNPLGSGGKLAVAFGNLIHHLYDYSKSKNSGPRSNSYAPREFKTMIGHFNSIFSGYQQQDSQEFLACLLDGLHEDLNRIIKKPYTEKPEIAPDLIGDFEQVKKLAKDCWDNHKLRNDSIVLDLFVGLYKSTLKCPECNHVSLTFDPYNDLTLPIPTDSKWTHNIYILRDAKKSRVQSFTVELEKVATYIDLKKELSTKLNINEHELFGFEIFQNQFYRNFQFDNKTEINFLPIGDLISESDVIVFYEIKDIKPNDIIIPVIHTLQGQGTHYNNVTAFGIPFFIKLNETEAKSFGYIREKIEAKYSLLSTYNYFNAIHENELTSDQANLKKRKYYTINDFPSIEKLFEKNGIPLKIESDEDGLKKQKVTSIDESVIQSIIVKSNTTSQEIEKEEKTKIEENNDVTLNEDHNSEFELVEQAQKSLSNSQITGHVDETEYDSDVSIASPEFSGNFAFSIKLLRKHSMGRRNKAYDSDDDIYEDVVKDNEIKEVVIEVPSHTGSLNKLPNLIDELPAAKKLFYAYSVDDIYNYGLSSSSVDKGSVVKEKEFFDIETKSELPTNKNYNKEVGFAAVDKSQSDFLTDIANRINQNVDANQFPIDVPDDAPVDPPPYLSDEDVKITDSIENIPFSPIRLPTDDGTSVDEDAGNIHTLFSDRGSIDESSTASDMEMTSAKPTVVTDNHPILVNKGDCLVCEWDPNLHQVFFASKEEETSEGGKSTWNDPEIIPNLELEKHKKESESSPKKNLTLEDCMKTFAKPEILGQNDLWYCPHCKEHRQAEKKIEIWSTPDILTIHLKRFQNQRRFSDKIDSIVEFPINGLNMKPFICYENSNLPSTIEDDNDYIYDLFAVDNHYGGLGGGHYTSFAKNFVDTKWYYYDDSSVRFANPEDSIKGSAYLLFYRKRSSKSLGGEKLAELLDEARKSEELRLQQLKMDEINSIQEIVNQIVRFERLNKEYLKSNAEDENIITVEFDNYNDGDSDEVVSIHEDNNNNNDDDDDNDDDEVSKPS